MLFMKGEVIYLYAFDVANEIITGKVPQLFASKPVPFEIRIDHTLPKDIPLYKPLSIDMEPLEASLGKNKVRSHIHIYEIGVISIALRVSFEVAKLSDLAPF